MFEGKHGRQRADNIKMSLLKKYDVRMRTGMVKS
jgi:hypothetical protein